MLSIGIFFFTAPQRKSHNPPSQDGGENQAQRTEVAWTHLDSGNSPPVWISEEHSWA